MALADPQSVTINSVANSLPRVGTNENHSNYRKDDGTVEMTVSHQPGKVRTRDSVRLRFTKIAADPLLAGVNREVSLSVFFNVDRPLVGLTTAEIKDISTSLTTWLTASSGANLTKVLGGEH
jgi:hypothetical protein